MTRDNIYIIYLFDWTVLTNGHAPIMTVSWRLPLKFPLVDFQWSFYGLSHTSSNIVLFFLSGERVLMWIYYCLSKYSLIFNSGFLKCSCVHIDLTLYLHFLKTEDIVLHPHPFIYLRLFSPSHHIFPLYPLIYWG